MLLIEGQKSKLQPTTDIGSGSVQEKEKALLVDIIEKLNDLFDGELTEDDNLVYVNDVRKGKLLESDLFVQHTSNNTKEQFGNSPDLASGILNITMDSLAAPSTMNKQTLESKKVHSGLKKVAKRMLDISLPNDIGVLEEVAKGRRNPHVSASP
jgi:type I restriction enzyme R subunit